MPTSLRPRGLQPSKPLCPLLWIGGPRFTQFKETINCETQPPKRGKIKRYQNLNICINSQVLPAFRSIKLGGNTRKTAIKRCLCVRVLSRVWLFAIPWTVALQVPLFVEFSQQEYWNGLPLPLPGDLPNPGIEPASLVSPALAGRFLTANATWKAKMRKKILWKVLLADDMHSSWPVYSCLNQRKSG